MAHRTKGRVRDWAAGSCGKQIPAHLSAPLSLWLSWGRSEPSLGRILRMKESLFITLPPPENRMGLSGPALNPESCSSFCLWLAGALFPSPRERFSPHFGCTTNYIYLWCLLWTFVHETFTTILRNEHLHHSKRFLMPLYNLSPNPCPKQPVAIFCFF